MTTPASRFQLDVRRTTAQVRGHIAEGTVTGDSTDGARTLLIDVLNDVVAIEMVCHLRYRQHAVAAVGLSRARVADEFGEHAVDERRHASWAVERVAQLGGTPQLNPSVLATPGDAEHGTVDEAGLTLMVGKNLVAKYIVIQAYRETIDWIGESDPVSRRLVEKILAGEEQHAAGLVGLLSARRRRA